MVNPMLSYSIDMNQIEYYLEDDRYAFERKYDGERIIAAVNNGSVMLTNRNKVDVTDRYPDIVESLSALDGIYVFDGEIIYVPEKNNTFQIGGEYFHFHGILEDFNKLTRRSRLQNKRKIKMVAKAIPVCYMIFDIIFADNTNLTEKTYLQRKRHLGNIDFTCIKNIFPVFGITDNKSTLVRCMEHYNYEGILIKKIDSTYEYGSKSVWMKAKNVKDANLVFDTYEVNNAGIKLIKTTEHPDDELSLSLKNKPITVQCSGQQHHEVRQQLDSKNEVMVKVNYLNYTSSKRLRQPTFNRLIV